MMCPNHFLAVTMTIGLIILEKPRLSLKEPTEKKLHSSFHRLGACLIFSKDRHVNL